MGIDATIIFPRSVPEGEHIRLIDDRPLTGEALVAAQPNLPEIPYIPVPADVLRGIADRMAAVAYSNISSVDIWRALPTAVEQENVRNLAHFLAVTAMKAGATQEAAAKAGGDVYSLLTEALRSSRE